MVIDVVVEIVNPRGQVDATGKHAVIAQFVAHLFGFQGRGPMEQADGLGIDIAQQIRFVTSITENIGNHTVFAHIQVQLRADKMGFRILETFPVYGKVMTVAIKV